MLLAFRTANHRSLREPQTLDLRSVYQRDRQCVNIVALYGANASGKSNVLDALRFMLDAVTSQTRDWRPDEGVPRRPFLLDSEATNEPSSFAVDLLIDDVRYTYGFSVDDHAVLEEWLFSYPHKKRRTLFERHGTDYRFGNSLRGTRVPLLRDITPENMLLLSSVQRIGSTELSKVAGWFREKLWFADDDNSDYRRVMTRELLDGPEKTSRAIELLRVADLGITDVQIHVKGSQNADKAARFALQLGSSPPIELEIKSGQEVDVLSNLFAVAAQSMKFTHIGKTGANLSFRDESRGTKTWFDLVGITVAALRNGWVLVIDELDTSLHPLLIRQLVKLFQDRTTNPLGAQLIFTTHDASLLSRIQGEETLRRDEIWFAEKDSQTGESTIYPLTDFQPREGLNWEKRYLGGALGAVPFVTEEAFTHALSDGSDDDA
ncbi:ATP-binding protein [Sphaerisporangium sp. NPDC051011]|uniref:AAA family ATPase n=1 Tax=Sphaerisporangium sp. NPDC051011 TaxID=3155792 RepID=UPI0033C8D1EE